MPRRILYSRHNIKKLPAYDKRKSREFFVNRVRKQIHYSRAEKEQLTGYHIGVGVLDSGIFPHEDLKDQIRAFRDFTNKYQLVCKKFIINAKSKDKKHNQRQNIGNVAAHPVFNF